MPPTVTLCTQHKFCGNNSVKWANERIDEDNSYSLQNNVKVNSTPKTTQSNVTKSYIRCRFVCSNWIFKKCTTHNVTKIQIRTGLLQDLQNTASSFLLCCYDSSSCLHCSDTGENNIKSQMTFSHFWVVPLGLLFTHQNIETAILMKQFHK